MAFSLGWPESCLERVDVWTLTTPVFFLNIKNPLKQGSACLSAHRPSCISCHKEPSSDFRQVPEGKKRCPFLFLTAPPQTLSLLIFKEQHIVLRSKTKPEFPKAPSSRHTAAHLGLAQTFGSRPVDVQYKKAQCQKQQHVEDSARSSR